jgi:hypothetical protein
MGVPSRHLSGVTEESHERPVSIAGVSIRIIIYCYYHYLIELQMGFYPVTVVPQDTTQKDTHVTLNDTPRSNKTQHTSYTNNRGHITRNERKAVPVTGRAGRDSNLSPPNMSLPLHLLGAN